MLKAVFLDYTGTIAQEQNGYALKMAQLIAENSSLHDMPEIFRIWWAMLKELEDASYGDSYRTEDQIAEKALDLLGEKYGFCGSREAFMELAHLFWSKSPAFGDVKEFFERCPLPVYIVTNNGEEYVNVFLRDNGLRCQGIVCGDMVKAYKPHRELFVRALEISRCAPDEAVHIGDSVTSDVRGAQSAGIRPILLDRGRKNAAAGYLTAASLTEVLPYLRGDIPMESS